MPAPTAGQLKQTVTQFVSVRSRREKEILVGEAGLILKSRRGVAILMVMSAVAIMTLVLAEFTFDGRAHHGVNGHFI